jgi:hypothetical protein
MLDVNCGIKSGMNVGLGFMTNLRKKIMGNNNNTSNFLQSIQSNEVWMEVEVPVSQLTWRLVGSFLDEQILYGLEE